MLISESDAIRLLEQEAYLNRDNFNGLDRFLSHCYHTGKNAEENAKRLDLCPEEHFLAGYFHDIGRCFAKDKKDHTFHEIIGARYIESEGVRLEISDSQLQCDRIAQSIRSHFLVYEQFLTQEYALWLPGLRDTNPNLLLPKSWNEIIIVYSDLTNSHGTKISFEDRLADIKERDRKTKNLRLAVIERSEARLFALKEDLEFALRDGKADPTKYPIL